MFAFIMVIHLLLAVALIGVVLLQRSEGGALGIGGGGGGMMSGRSAANLLTRITGYLAAGFILTSLVLAILSGRADKPVSILDAAQPAVPGAVEGAVPGAPPADSGQPTPAPTPAQPPLPAQPMVPLSR
jgi:preprotein translocase subunit SecG